MNALLQTLQSCIASGAVFTSLCAALTIPVIAWFIVRRLTPEIVSMENDRRWQSALAAAAAITPGFIFITLVAYGLSSSASSPCLQTIPGRVLFGGLSALMVGTILRSLLLALRREREMNALVAQAYSPSHRLARFGAEIGVAVYELPDSERPVVMFAGTRRPAVYVSTNALERLSDEELRAALHHERAHYLQHDHRIAPAVHFFADLLPLSVDNLVRLYRRSREFCADEYALSYVERTELAGALLRVARPILAPAHASLFADIEMVRGRLDALLRPSAPKPVSSTMRFAVASALALTMVASVAVPQLAAFAVHCSQMGSLS